jgi:hypothetical protein
MKNRERYPKLTTLRAFNLLRRLDEHAEGDAKLPKWVLDEVRDALANHVRSGLVSAQRRRKVRARSGGTL